MSNWIKDILKKIIIAIVLAGMLFGFTNFLNFSTPNRIAGIPRANAIPVIDIIQAVLQGLWEGLSEVWQYLQEEAYPALRDLAAKRITDYVTQQTIDWINNGTEPTFISDWRQFASDAANIAFDSYNTYLNKVGIDLCSPFVPQLQIMLSGTFLPQQPVRCGIDDFKQNISNSLNLVQNGGWISYTQAFMPEGNLIGMYVQGESQVVSEAISRKTAAINQALAGGGYKGTSECTDASCTNSEITTPGSSIGSAVASAITSDTQWGVNIQSYTSAIVNALITKLLQKGLSHLKGSSAVSEYKPIVSPGGTAQLDSIKSNILSVYEDVVYYFDSTDYPTLQTWKDVQSLAQQGISSCVPPDDWQSKFDSTSAIVSGLQTMLDAATANINDINLIDPTTMDQATVTEKIQQATVSYQAFTTNYQSLLSDVTQAKQNGDMTDTEKTAILEKNNLTQSLTTAPNCGPTEISQ